MGTTETLPSSCTCSEECPSSTQINGAPHPYHAAAPLGLGKTVMVAIKAVHRRGGGQAVCSLVCAVSFATTLRGVFPSSTLSIPSCLRGSSSGLFFFLVCFIALQEKMEYFMHVCSWGYRQQYLYRLRPLSVLLQPVSNDSRGCSFWCGSPAVDGTSKYDDVVQLRVFRTPADVV